MCALCVASLGRVVRTSFGSDDTIRSIAAAGLAPNRLYIWLPGALAGCSKVDDRVSCASTVIMFGLSGYLSVCRAVARRRQTRRGGEGY